MDDESIISPAMAVWIFSVGTGAIGVLANYILAQRTEGARGVDLRLLLLAVVVSSALNILFSAMLPVKE